jgi:UDP-N-acetyl-D-mannosaminuronic acid dehydrogenase
MVPTPTSTFDDAVRDADVVVVATNHSAYSSSAALARAVELASPDALIVDPWNAFGTAQVFAYAAELGAPLSA